MDIPQVKPQQVFLSEWERKERGLLPGDRLYRGDVWYNGKRYRSEQKVTFGFIRFSRVDIYAEVQKTMQHEFENFLKHHA